MEGRDLHMYCPVCTNTREATVCPSPSLTAHFTPTPHHLPPRPKEIRPSVRSVSSLVTTWPGPRYRGSGGGRTRPPGTLRHPRNSTSSTGSCCTRGERRTAVEHGVDEYEAGNVRESKTLIYIYSTYKL